MKRLFVLLLVLSMLISIAGCGEKDDNATGKESSEPAKTSSEPAKTSSEDAEKISGEYSRQRFDETVTIRIGKDDGFQFYGQDDDYKSPEDNVWIDSFKEELNVEFDFLWINTESGTSEVKWNTAIASGNLPDMAVVGKDMYESLILDGFMADMTDAFEEYASPLLKELFEPSFERPYMTRNGRLYGLPQIKAYPERFHMLCLRQDWLDKVNMEVPKTIDDLIEVARAFKESQLGGENTYGLAAGHGSWGALKGFYQGYGVPYGVWAEDENGDVYYGMTDERMNDALLQLQSMYAEGLLREDYLIANTAESINAGEVGLMYSIFHGPVNATDLYMMDEEVDLIFSEIPTIDGSLPLYYDPAVPGVFVFVNKDFDNQKAAVEVINLIVDNLFDDSYDWGYLRSACPIGGVMYERPYPMAEYGREIEYAYETGDLSKFSTANARIYYDRLMAYERDGNREMGRYHPIYRPKVGSYSIINKVYQDNRIVNTAYMGIDTETMVERRAMLDQVLTDAMDKVIMGDDISVWKNAVEEWYNTGGQTMTDEVNEWHQNLK